MALRGSLQPEPERSIDPVANLPGGCIWAPVSIICSAFYQNHLSIHNRPIRTVFEPYPDGDNPDHLVSRNSIILRQEEVYKEF